MADLPSRDDLRRKFTVSVLSPPGGRRPRITRSALETAGADANAFREGAAAVGDECVAQLSDSAAGWWIDSARGEQLDKRVLDTIRMKRKDAANSRGSVQWRVKTPKPSDFDIPAETSVGTGDGVEFLTTIGITFPAASLGPVSAPVRSVRAGANVIAPPDTIRGINSQIAGAPDDLEVTNELATTPGDDEEPDEGLRAAYRGFFRAAEKGTIAALRSGALRFPGVVSAEVLEYYDVLGRQSKQVLIAIADKYTADYISANTVPPTYAARSQVLASQVLASINDIRSAGIYVGCFVSKIIPLPVALSLTFQAGADPFEVAQRARTAVANYVNQLPPGAPFRRVDCSRELRRVRGLYVTGGEVVSPIGDIVPRVLEKFGTDLRFITANSSAVEKPLPTLYVNDGYIVGG